MRILHVAPVWLPVSRQSHGGIETFLADLVVAQQQLGHDVTLVAAADSEVPVPLVEAVPESLVPVMERGEAGEYGYYEQELVGAALRAAAHADVVHNHVLPGALVLDAALGGAPPVLHTLHGQLTQDVAWSLRHHPRAVVGVSNVQSQLAQAQGVQLFGVSHNGIDMQGLPFSPRAGDDLLFLGRIEPQKGPDLAIRAARTIGRRIVLAGPVTDRPFFDEVVAPLLADDAEHVGVLGREQKYAALARSACLLVPSRWTEPFGMVAVEAMAVGTPVAALAAGALPEVVDDGVTGRVVDDTADLVDAVREACELDRELVRKTAWQRFHITAAAERYLGLYEQLLGRASGS